MHGTFPTICVTGPKTPWDIHHGSIGSWWGGWCQEKNDEGWYIPIWIVKRTGDVLIFDFWKVTQLYCQAQAHGFGNDDVDRHCIKQFGLSNACTFSGWWQLKYVLFSPRSLGKWSILTHIFQMGGFNHQLGFLLSSQLVSITSTWFEVSACFLLSFKHSRSCHCHHYRPPNRRRLVYQTLGERFRWCNGVINGISRWFCVARVWPHMNSLHATSG